MWDVARGSRALEAALDCFSHPLVLGREFLYVYKGKGLPPGQGSYTFRYWLGSRERTLSGDDLEGFRQSLLEFLKAENISLRA